jgi:hypothetical protein
MPNNSQHTTTTKTSMSNTVLGTDYFGLKKTLTISLNTGLCHKLLIIYKWKPVAYLISYSKLCSIEICPLLGYYTVHGNNSLLTFWDNLLVPF